MNGVILYALPFVLASLVYWYRLRNLMGGQNRFPSVNYSKTAVIKRPTDSEAALMREDISNLVMSLANNARRAFHSNNSTEDLDIELGNAAVEALSRKYPEYGVDGRCAVHIPSTPPRGTFHFEWIGDISNHSDSCSIGIALVENGEISSVGVICRFCAFDEDSNDVLLIANDGDSGNSSSVISFESRTTVVSVPRELEERYPVWLAKRLSPLSYRVCSNAGSSIASVTVQLDAITNADAAIVAKIPPHFIPSAHSVLRSRGCVLLDARGNNLSYTHDGSLSSDLYLQFVIAAKTLDLARRIVEDLKFLKEEPKDLEVDDCITFAGSSFQFQQVPINDVSLGSAADYHRIISRARGCLLGQIGGDSLGQLVEFRSKKMIANKYPQGMRTLLNGGVWQTIAGQPTDDSELALMLSRSILRMRRFDLDDIRKSYVWWMNSGPFDIGGTTRAGLMNEPNFESQANGALMRVSPLGIFGWNQKPEMIRKWAMEESALTHPNKICGEVSALFASAIAFSIREGPEDPHLVYNKIVEWANKWRVDHSVVSAIEAARTAPPAEFFRRMGWVILAFQNALFHLLNTPSLSDALEITVQQGGDTDTNAAICGALLGSFYGIDCIPQQWIKSIESCRPMSGLDGVEQPRPCPFWPIDACMIAENLVRLGLI